MIVQPHNPDRAAKAQVQLDKAAQILNMSAEQDKRDADQLARALGKHTNSTITVTSGANR